jgi:hypothetical protein
MQIAIFKVNFVLVESFQFHPASMFHITHVSYSKGSLKEMMRNDMKFVDWTYEMI